MTLKPHEQVLLWITKIGLWVIPFLPLYVSSSMLFPFITGKNFVFRIIVEVIFIAWFTLSMLRPDFRPRLTTLFKFTTIFIAVLFLADLFSPNPYRAFFSNYERMEGFMMLSHLYLYFVMLVSVFKTKRDWLIFFHTTLAASLIISYIALLQRLGYRISLQGGFRVDSTIGNPTYLAAYLVFHVWLLLILMYKFWKKWWLVGLYSVALIFEMAIIYFTATRGAVLALVGAAIFLSIACFIFWKRMFPSSLSMRKWAGTVFLVIALIPISFLFMRDSEFVRVNPALNRLTSYSFQERTIQSRFMIWRMSSKAVLERPLFGWGQENYYLVFQKYFDPRLYAQEPWFDRSHNVIFDWLVHAGFLGLFSYLAMLGSAVWLVFRSMLKRSIHPFEGLMLSALFFTYFVQDIFVFDNLNTYLLLFGFFAYVEYLGILDNTKTPEAVSGSKDKYRNIHAKDAGRGGVNPGLALASSSALIVFFAIFGYQAHVKPILESKALIGALQAYQMQLPADDIINAFKRALAYGTFGDTEVREQFSNLARGVLDNPKYTEEDKKKIVEFSVEELRKEASGDAPDVKHKLFIGSLMSRAASLNQTYGVEAEQMLHEAVLLSPGKQIIYFELAQVYLNQGQVDKAIDTLQKAVDLEPAYQDAVANLLAVGYLAKRQDAVERAKTYLKLDKMSGETIERVANIYQQAGDYTEARAVYEFLVAQDPKNARYHASFASYLAYFGEVEHAIQEARLAAELDPGLEVEVKGFIEKLTGSAVESQVEIETVP